MDKQLNMKMQRIPNHQYTYTCKFDFEIGYLVESPCRCCEQLEELPNCARACHLIDRVRGLLADTIPCTHRW